MAIGNNTFWIIVSLLSHEACLNPKDARQALRFTSAEAAQAYAEKWPDFDPAFYIVVRVRG